MIHELKTKWMNCECNLQHAQSSTHSLCVYVYANGNICIQIWCERNFPVISSTGVMKCIGLCWIPFYVKFSRSDYKETFASLTHSILQNRKRLPETVIIRWCGWTLLKCNLFYDLHFNHHQNVHSYTAHWFHVNVNHRHVFVKWFSFFQLRFTMSSFISLKIRSIAIVHRCFFCLRLAMK